MSENAVAEPAGDDILPIVAGAAVLALAGGAVLMTRRRRHEDEELDVVPDVIDTDHVAPVERAPAPVARTAPPAAAETTLPATFDLSRYGPHVQAAYRGPTADNPSLSLRKRLKRARAFDQRERMAREAVAAPQAPTASPAEVAPAPAVAAPRQTVVRPAAKPLGSFRPAFQS